jgi:glucose-6-phosphate 1-dehydrogenase
MDHPPARPHGLEVESVPGRPLVAARTPDPCALVIFGATGDLTGRKLIPALFNLFLDGALPENLAILAVGRQEMSTAKLRERLEESTREHSRRTPIEPDAWARFSGAIEYVRGDVDDTSLYANLEAALSEADEKHGTSGNHLFYLATPPGLFPVILERLHGSGLVTRQRPDASPWQRVIVEKPIGHDLSSARELNALMTRVMREHQTFRIDHYLGKETVQNILTLRFGNAIFEPLWNRTHVDHVQITAAESIGVEDRGHFYDGTGVVRDIVQNHLLQTLSLCAMEPPATFSAEAIRTEKAKILTSLQPIVGGCDERSVVLGQYEGYLEEPGVGSGSTTPTFVAMRIMIDNWRWQGVPFYLRAGKGLAAKRTEIAVQFKAVPLCLFPQEQACQRLEPNVLVLGIQPDEGVSLQFVSKIPGDDVNVGRVLMYMKYADAFDRPIADAYERLLLDGMRGDATLFARRDSVEEAWKFISPILEACDDDAAPSPRLYERGGEGPEAATALMSRDGRRWRDIRGV